MQSYYICIASVTYSMSYVCVSTRRLAGDQRARRDARHDSDAEDDDDVKKVRIRSWLYWKSVRNAVNIRLESTLLSLDTVQVQRQQYAAGV